jgi:DNA-binding MarR family transcriptional regulator
MGEEAEKSEIALAAFSFGAGGIPASRAGASIVQGIASAVSQLGIKGEVDVPRVMQEMVFAGIFGNPSFKELRQSTLNQSLSNKDWTNLNDAVRKDPNGIVAQMKENGESAKAAWILKMAKELNDTTLKVMETAGGEDVKNSVRDIRAQQQGDVLIHPDVPSGSLVPPKTPKLQRGPNNQQRIYGYLNEQGAATTDMISEATGLTRSQVWDTVKKMNNKGHIQKGRDPAGAGTYSLGPGGGEVAKALDIKAPIREDLEKALAEQEPRKVTEGPEAQAATDQQQRRTMKALEDLEDAEIDVHSLTETQQADIAEGLIAGKSKAEIEGLLADPSTWPDDLVGFREVVERKARQVLNRKATASDVEIEDNVARLQKDPNTNDLPDQRQATEDISKDLEEVRKWAGLQESTIETSTNLSGDVLGYTLMRKGRRVLQDVPLEEIHAHVNALARGEVRPGVAKGSRYARFKILAKQKGLEVIQPPGEDFTIKNSITGETVTIPNKDFDAAAKYVTEHVDPFVEHNRLASDLENNGGPPADVTAPETVGPSVSSPGATMSIRSADDGLPPIDAFKKDQPLSKFQIAFKPVMSLFQHFDDRLDLNLFKDVWESGHEAASQRDIWQRPHEESLNKILTGIPLARQHVVHDLMLTEPFFFARRAKDLGAKRREMEAAVNMRNWYADVMEGDPVNITRGIRKLQAAEGNVNALKDNTLPKEFAPLLDDILNSNLRLTESNAVTLAGELLHAMGRKKFMSEPLQAMRKRQNALLIQQRKASGARKATLGQAVDLTGNYIDMLSKRTDQFAAQTSGALQGWSKAFEKLGLLRGDNLAPQDIERLAMMATSWYSGSVMSWRGALVMRNLAQPLLMAPKVGLRNTIKGYKDAINSIRSGEWAKLYESGVISEPAFFGFGGVAGSRVGGTVFQAQAGEGVGRTRQAVTQTAESTERQLRRMQSLGLWGFRRADQFNRAVSYYAAKNGIENARKHWEAGDIDEFKVQTGLYGNSRGVQKNILKLLEKGMWEEAGHTYGKMSARETQYLYSKAEAPPFFQGVKGRMFGQFGIWPMAYWDYMGRNLGGVGGGVKGAIQGPGVTLEALGRKFTKGERGKWARTGEDRYRALFMTRYLLQLSALYGVGGALGVNVSSWNKANPIAFEGGPALQGVRDILHLSMGTGTEYERSLAKNSAIRFIKQIVMPVGGLENDVQQALARIDRGDNPATVVMELLAFAMETTPRPN